MSYLPIEKDGQTFHFIQHVRPKQLVKENIPNLTVIFKLAKSDKIKRYENAILVKEKHNGWYGLYCTLPVQEYDN